MPGSEAATPAVDPMPQARKILGEVFSVVGIAKVVVVDDELPDPYAIEEFVGTANSLIAKDATAKVTDQPLLKGVPFDKGVEVWRPKLEEAWPKFSADQKKELWRALGISCQIDEARGSLAALLDGYLPKFLNLKEWRDQIETLLSESKASTTLFLFDLDMSKGKWAGTEDEGIRIISGLMKKEGAGSGFYCGLFSNHIEEDAEYESLEKLATEHGLTAHKSRFAVMSKQNLHKSPDSFASRLKRVAISPHCDALRQRFFAALKGAHDQAQSKVEELNVYDFEQMIFQSSYEEGVWEADTLLRIFTLYHREAARGLARKDLELLKSAESVRKLIYIPYRPGDLPKTRIPEIIRLERYESRAYLHEHRMPIEIGDIFKKTGGTRKFILLEQPCDVIVRGDDGRRNLDTLLVAAVQVKKRGTPIPKGAVELERYCDDPDEIAFVNFNEYASINANILDLCVFSDSGVAEMKVGATCPDGVIPAWKLRFPIIQKALKSAIDRYKQLVESKPAAAICQQIESSLVCSVPGFAKGRLLQSPDGIAYDFERVGRLRQPRAGRILREFHNHKSRDAFDHELDRTPSEKE